MLQVEGSGTILSKLATTPILGKCSAIKGWGEGDKRSPPLGIEGGGAFFKNTYLSFKSRHILTGGGGVGGRGS